MKFPDNIAAVAKIMDQGRRKVDRQLQGPGGRQLRLLRGRRGSDASMFMARVFDAAKELGVKRIVISECGHAYDAFRWTAPNIMDVPPGHRGHPHRPGGLRSLEGRTDQAEAGRLRRRRRHLPRFLQDPAAGRPHQRAARDPGLAGAESVQRDVAGQRTIDVLRRRRRRHLPSRRPIPCVRRLRPEGRSDEGQSARSRSAWSAATAASSSPKASLITRLDVQVRRLTDMVAKALEQ